MKVVTENTYYDLLTPDIIGLIFGAITV